MQTIAIIRHGWRTFAKGDFGVILYLMATFLFGFVIRQGPGFENYAPYLTTGIFVLVGPGANLLIAERVVNEWPPTPNEVWGWAGRFILALLWFGGLFLAWKAAAARRTSSAKRWLIIYAIYHFLVISANLLFLSLSSGIRS